MSCAASIENASLATQYNGLKGGGMCTATCSMWWLGWILYKTTQPEGSYQSGGTWSTGAALVSPLTKGRKKKKKAWPCDIQTKTSTELCTHGGHSCSFHFFFSFSLLQHFLGGSLPSQSYKANTVVWTRGGIRVNTGCCDVCGEWVTVCGGHSCYWASGAIFFLVGWDVLRSPVPPPRAHLLSHDNQTNGFHCCSQSPLTHGLWVALQRGAVWEAFLVQ